jgi:diketogulonate reductase-like aldo/keto reductase
LETLQYCESAGLSFLPWSPLGGYRHPERLTQDQQFAEIGRELGVSKQRVILAWELSLGEQVIPIPGFHRTQTLEDSLQAVDLEIPEELLQRLELTK